MFAATAHVDYSVITGFAGIGAALFVNTANAGYIANEVVAEIVRGRQGVWHRPGIPSQTRRHLSPRASMQLLGDKKDCRAS